MLQISIFLACSNLAAIYQRTEVSNIPRFALVSGLASWELDIRCKLRHAKKAAVFRYLATVEGKNFAATNLVAEVAASYEARFELIETKMQQLNAT